MLFTDGLSYTNQHILWMSPSWDLAQTQYDSGSHKSPRYWHKFRGPRIFQRSSHIRLSLNVMQCHQWTLSLIPVISSWDIICKYFYRVYRRQINSITLKSSCFLGFFIQFLLFFFQSFLWIWYTLSFIWAKLKTMGMKLVLIYYNYILNWYSLVFWKTFQVSDLCKNLSL